MQIYTVGALAGAAKSYNAIRFATAGVRAGEKYIFCVPSTGIPAQRVNQGVAAKAADVGRHEARTHRRRAGTLLRRLRIFRRGAEEHVTKTIVRQNEY